MRRLRWLLPLLLAAGCAARPLAPPDDQREAPVAAQERRAKAPRPAYNLSGYPPAAREGYIDGCESARHSEYARRDAERIASDAQYETGWNDGHAICGRQK